MNSQRQETPNRPLQLTVAASKIVLRTTLHASPRQVSFNRYLAESTVVPSRSDIIGRWSENAGYEADLSRDTVLDFRADGSLQIATDGEHIEGRWECEQPGTLVSIVRAGHRYGPFNVLVDLRRLPLGEFEVFESDGALLPYDRRHFVRLPAAR